MEQGVVASVENGKIMVEAEPNSCCEGCAIGHSCVIGAGAKRRLWMGNSLGAGVGDEVLFSIHPRAVILGSTLHYALPVAFLLAGIVSGALIGGRTGRELELSSLIGGAAGIALSVLIIGAVSVLMKKRSLFVPRLEEIVSASRKNNP
ncbi:MAG: hypothetical protein E4G96_00095 [Chrysiogenales bacterium]|nr:MAG: hypothetical protein E4G96_00095 [Chrysiogenales bacterium]